MRGTWSTHRNGPGQLMGASRAWTRRRRATAGADHQSQQGSTAETRSSEDTSAGTDALEGMVGVDKEFGGEEAEW